MAEQTISELVKYVIEILSEEAKKRIKEALKDLAKAVVKELVTPIHDFFKTKLEKEWIPLVKSAAEKGVEWGKKKLWEMKCTIVGTCNDNETDIVLLIDHAKYTQAQRDHPDDVHTQSGVAIVAKAGAKLAARQVASKVTTKAMTEVVRSAGRSALRVTSRELVRRSADVGLKAALTSAANPVGIGADIAQLGLELCGFKTCGKVVGAVGNMASGAMVGFVLGGPIGAGIGAAAGFGLWYLGEAVGAAVDWLFG